MRILTWNINGVRTLPQYHPWNTLKTFDDILNHLEADIVCFQEMKSSRQGLPKRVALPPSYDSFFSFPVRKTGYSGIAVYTRRDVVVPLKAEEGLTGLIQPRPPLTDDERISRIGTYPPDVIGPNPEDEDEPDYKDLDSEGRAVVVDLGLFVLINVYCPNDGTGTEEREKFKMDYHRLLEARVRGLINEGREVMVVGDLNACAAVQDHCEGELMVARGLAEGLEGEEGFWGKEYRRWIRDWLVKEDGTGGSMVDIVRKFWPDRKGMYTCWNTKISARETNYGTRIDFILITPGLVPWVKAADIQPHVKGSDHCPVFIDLWDEITNPDGTVTKLHDVLGARGTDGSPAEPPRLAAKFWDEYKQKLLSTFFGKKSDDGTLPKQPPPIASEKSSTVSSQSSQSGPSFGVDTIDFSTSPSTSQAQLPAGPISPPRFSNPTSTKHKLAADNTKTSTKKLKLSQVRKKDSMKAKMKPKQKAGQSTLGSFFSQPEASSSKSSSSKASKFKGKAPAVNALSPSDEVSASLANDPEDVDEDADFQLALLLSQSDDGIIPPCSSSQLSATGSLEKEQGKQAWNTLLAPTQVPKCTVHREPAKEFTVNKPGPNKGKKFFICSRPVGPGYDKGRSERLREHVDPQWKCNFFKWSSDVRKEMTRNGNGHS